MTTLKAIDFFCGGGGMTCGLKQAGIDVIAGVDCDSDAKETYEANNKGSTFVHADIQKLDTSFFKTEFGVTPNDDNMIFVGCSPCQYYSIINTDKRKSSKSKDLLRQFARFIEFYRPGFVLVENVPGLLTNKDSIYPWFEAKLNEFGYQIDVSEVVDMSYYGVPQSRRRVSIVATRIRGIKVSLPQKEKKQSVVADFLGVKNNFKKVPAGYKDTTPFNHTVAGLSEKCLRRIEKTKHNGGSRLDWASDPELQLKCFEGRNDSFKDTFGRMSWNKPAPTITTKFFSLSNGRFGHPDENRAISLREGATLQTFPLDYVFKTSSISATAKLIGNAVPCEYARRLGETITSVVNNGKVQDKGKGIRFTR